MNAPTLPSDGPFRPWSTAAKSLMTLPSPPSASALAAKFISPHDFLVQSRMPATRVLAPTENLYSLQSTKRMIQRIIVATSTCTIVLVLITFVLFWRMQQKRLRHKLVMLSILGCFIRGLWYFIFSCVVISGVVIQSTSGICQATGFFIHIGNEMSDIATLLIAIHGALQIFRPSVSTLDIGDGLYDYQQYCFTAIALLPIILASISFVNSGPAYTAQGAFCSLPTSPIWYRIALSYAPRYLIALTVVCLSIAVYIHVELKFRSFAKSARASRTSIALPSGQSPPLVSQLHSLHEPQAAMMQGTSHARAESLPVLRTPNYGDSDRNDPSLMQQQSPKTAKPDLNTSQDDTIREYFPSTVNTTSLPGRKISIATTVSRDTASTSNKSRASLPGMATLKRTHSAIQRLAGPSSGISPQLTALQKQDAERKALRRQLRLIFVYPIVYVLLWIPPMILNAMQYSPRYAGDLPPWLGALSNVCLTLMGGVDCIVFFWREKPWRQSRSRSSSTTLLLRSNTESRDLEKAEDAGSRPEDRSAQDGRSFTLSTLAGKVTSLLPKRSKPTRTASTVAKQRAYERLALEIKDRNDHVRRSVDEQNNTEVPAADPESSQADQVQDVRQSGKQWWDRQDSVSQW